MPAEQSNEKVRRPDVVLRLDRRRAEALREAAAYAISHADFVASLLTRDTTMGAEDLRAALDYPPVEERRKFRVMAGDEEFGEDELDTLSEAQAEAGVAADLGLTPTIQSRTITTFSDGSTLISPWTDLEGEGEQQ